MNFRLAAAARQVVRSIPNGKLTQQLNIDMNSIARSAEENNDQIATVTTIMREISDGADHVARTVSTLFKDNS